MKLSELGAVATRPVWLRDAGSFEEREWRSAFLEREIVNTFDPGCEEAKENLKQKITRIIKSPTASAVAGVVAGAVMHALLESPVLDVATASPFMYMAYEKFMKSNDLQQRVRDGVNHLISEVSSEI